jgi:hypothetical protein
MHTPPNPGRVAALLAVARKLDFASRALAVEAWTALRYGELDRTGALVWSGRRDLVLDPFDGARQLVTLAELPTT